MESSPAFLYTKFHEAMSLLLSMGLVMLLLNLDHIATVVAAVLQSKIRHGDMERPMVIGGGLHPIHALPMDGVISCAVTTRCAMMFP